MRKCDAALDYRLLAGLFLAFVILQELFWFLMSRVTVVPFRSYYYVSGMGLFEFLLFLSLLLSVALMYFFSIQYIRPFSKFRVGSEVFLTVVILSISLNIFLFFYLSGRARYEPGGLSGVGGVLYYASFVLNMLVSVVYARHGAVGLPKAGLRYAFYFFLVSLMVRADGMASVLFVFCLFVVYRGFRAFSSFGFFVSLFFGSLALYIGFVSKWSTVPEYLSLEFFLRWVVARFSIQAEQAYIYVAGESILELGVCGFCDIFYNTLQSRLIFSGLISGEYVFPRSVSEAFYYDLNGEFGSGSSPGLFLGTVVLGPLAPIAIIMISVVFVNFFYRSFNRISFIYFPFLAFFSKGVHANVTEFFVILSPVWISLIFFVFACLIEMRPFVVSCSDD